MFSDFSMFSKLTLCSPIRDSWISPLYLLCIMVQWKIRKPDAKDAGLSWWLLNSPYYLKTAPSAPSSHSPAAVDAKCRFLTLHPHLIIASLPIPFSHKTYNIYIPRFICVNIQTQKRQQGSLLMCMLQIGKLSWVNENTLSGLFFFLKKQDSVSNMQKTGLTNHSSFLIWSGLEKGINQGGQ